MDAWLNQSLASHLTPWVYLTAASVATGLLLLLWFTRTYHPAHLPRRRKHDQPRRGSLRACVSLVLATWAAVALRNEWDQSEPIPFFTAITLFVLSWLTLTFAPRLWRSWQTRRRANVARQCVGQVGRVYQTISAETDSRPGSVTIEQGSKHLRLPALSKTGEPLPAFCDVEVTGINDDGVLWVVRQG